MGRQNKKMYAGAVVKKTDLRKKANRDDRREIRQNLNSGNYEELEQVKKFSGNTIKWED